MRRWPFFWHIFPSFLLITLLACAFIIVYALNAARSFYAETEVAALRAGAVLLERELGEYLAERNPGADSLVDRLGNLTDTRITLILPDGRVLADSERDPSTMENHADRPELIEAFRGDTGESTRYSTTMSRDYMYVAVPVYRNERVIGALRTSLPVLSVSQDLGMLTPRLVAAGAIVAIIVVLLSLAISQRLSQPLKDLTQGAVQFAQGDFSVGLPIPSTEEAARLALAMNTMAEQLDERIKAIMHKTNEQDAILSAMIEGVVAVDQDERILMLNQAAGRMLGVRPSEVRGRMIQEAVRSPQLQRFIRRLLDTRAPLTAEISAALSPFTEERTLDVHGTVLRGSNGGLSGVLVALHDITHLRRLENLRREFVANVSHELRTPLTSIKGFVETLLDGAMEEPRERHRFLQIIGHHVNRLNSLVEDLFMLSRLEKEEGNGAIEVVSRPLERLVSNAVEVCSSKASEKAIDLKTTNEEGVTAQVNVALFEQAVINLIDNAVKYSENDTAVEVSSGAGNGEVWVSVRDEGPGIPSEHLERLFERFYRIDKARSRKLGGTGLGLSIVKHIMNAHGGRVTVESTPGHGSTFTLRLPAVVGINGKESA